MKLNDSQAVTAKLLILCGEHGGDMVPVNCSPFLIGRSNDCDLRSTCPLVSRYQCALMQTAAGLMIRDLGSKHGTCVNNELIHEGRLLQNGDQIYVGMEIYEVRLTAENSKARSILQRVQRDRQEKVYAPVRSYGTLLYYNRQNENALAN